MRQETGAAMAGSVKRLMMATALAAAGLLGVGGTAVAQVAAPGAPAQAPAAADVVAGDHLADAIAAYPGGGDPGDGNPGDGDPGDDDDPGSPAGPPAAGAGNPTVLVRQSLSQSLARDVAALAALPAGDPRSLFAGGTPENFRSKLGPAQAAAAVAAATGDATALWRATAICKYLVKTYQQPGGVWLGHNDVETEFAAGAIGFVLHLVGPRMPAADRALLTSSVTRAADYLVANRNLAYYTNGNINIGNTVVFAAAYEQTHNPVYQADFETALSFATDPKLPRWNGFGLFYTKRPTKADGSDGKAYFAESGGGFPGYDADYTQLQLDQVTRLYLMTRDPRAARLVNLLFNQEWPRIDTTSWLLDTSGGTRHPEAQRHIGWNSPAMMVLVARGMRPEFRDYLPGQLAHVVKRFDQTVNAFSREMYYSYGEPAMALAATLG
jgi:hypothetical protein